MEYAAVTGHRPPKLGGYGKPARERLIKFARRVIVSYPETTFLSGMALGWDQAIAEACVLNHIPFVACVPFKGQERAWPEPAQKRYTELLKQAEEVVILAHEYTDGAMLKRNKYMVDRTDNELIALWNGDYSGGTAHCVRYAQSRGLEVTNVWDKYREFINER